MAISVNVQRWVSPWYYTVEKVLYLQLMIPPKRFDLSPSDWGCSEGLDAFRFFFKHAVFNRLGLCTVTRMQLEGRNVPCKQCFASGLQQHLIIICNEEAVTAALRTLQRVPISSRDTTASSLSSNPRTNF